MRFRFSSILQEQLLALSFWRLAVSSRLHFAIVEGVSFRLSEASNENRFAFGKETVACYVSGLGIFSLPPGAQPSAEGNAQNVVLHFHFAPGDFQFNTPLEFFHRRRAVLAVQSARIVHQNYMRFQLMIQDGLKLGC